MSIERLQKRVMELSIEAEKSFAAHNSCLGSLREAQYALQQSIAESVLSETIETNDSKE